MRIKNFETGKVHAGLATINNDTTCCGISTSSIYVGKVDDDVEITCKNCRRATGLKPIPLPLIRNKPHEVKKMKNTETGKTHAISDEYDGDLTYCGLSTRLSNRVSDNMTIAGYDSHVDLNEDITCKNCRRAMGLKPTSLALIGNKPSGFECSVLKTDFTPFTLNMRLTTRTSAKNLYDILKGALCDSRGLNHEQRKMVLDICDTLSNNVTDIKIKSSSYIPR